MLKMLKNKPLETQRVYQERTAHYLSYLPLPKTILEYPIIQDTVLGIFEFAPTEGRPFWTHLTSGMSETAQMTSSGNSVFIEIIFYSVENSTWVDRFLTNLASYPFENKECFSPRDTLPMERSLYEGSKLTSLLLLEPLLENPEISPMFIQHKQVDILWALPITEMERQFMITNGNEVADQWINKCVTLNNLPKLLDFNRDSLL